MLPDKTVESNNGINMWHRLNKEMKQILYLLGLQFHHSSNFTVSECSFDNQGIVRVIQVNGVTFCNVEKVILKAN
jgi:hypothetical protein